MLTIRPDQMAAFQAEADLRFARFMVTQLRRRHPVRAANFDDAALEAEALAGLLAARSYGFEDATAALRFIDARFRFGPSFDRAPAILALLRDSARSPVERIDAAVAAILAKP